MKRKLHAFLIAAMRATRPVHLIILVRMTIISGEQCKGRSILCHFRHQTVTHSNVQMFSITATRNGRLKTQVLSRDCNSNLKIAMLFEYLPVCLEQCFYRPVIHEKIFACNCTESRLRIIAKSGGRELCATDEMGGV